MDFLSPIDIQKINGESNKNALPIGRLATKKIQETLSFLTVEKNVQKTRDLITFMEGTMLQPYNPSVIGAGKDMGAFDKRTLTIEVGMLLSKADEPERYRDTWLATLSELELKPEQLPFSKWYLETLAIIAEQDLVQLPFLGKKGAGTTVVDICDGYHEIVNDEITATNISSAKGNLYDASAYTAANIGDQLKEQYLKFPDQTQQRGGILAYVPWNMRELYREFLINKYQYQVADGDVKMDYLDGTDKKVKHNWLAAMGSSQRVYMTTAGILKYGLSSPDIYGKITVFNPNGNPYLVQATKKVPIGFQIQTLDSRAFNSNDILTA